MTGELEELEREGWRALSGPDGAAFYEEVMADDGVMVFPGVVMDKRTALEAIAGADPWQTFELEDIRVIQPNPDAAIVVYLATAQRKGQPVYRAEMASHYARREGRWRLVLHQQSPSS